MKKLRITARERIINYATQSLHDDEGLKALSGYHEKDIEVDDNYDINQTMLALLEECPELKGLDLEITEL